jgi:hypothetical protein
MVYNLVRFHAEIKGKHVGAGSYNDLHSNLNPSVAVRKSFDDNRFETHDTFTKPVHDNTADDTCVASTDSDETVLPTSFPLESKNPVNVEVRSSSKRSKKKRHTCNRRIPRPSREFYISHWINECPTSK